MSIWAPTASPFNKNCASGPGQTILDTTGNSVAPCVSSANFGDQSLSGAGTGSNINSCMTCGNAPSLRAWTSTQMNPNANNWLISQESKWGAGANQNTNPAGTWVGYHTVLFLLHRKSLTGGKVYRDGIPNGAVIGANPVLNINGHNTDYPGMMYIGDNLNIRYTSGLPGGPHNYDMTNGSSGEWMFSSKRANPSLSGPAVFKSDVNDGIGYNQFPVWPDYSTMATASDTPIIDHPSSQPGSGTGTFWVKRTFSCGDCSQSTRTGTGGGPPWQPGGSINPPSGSGLGNGAKLFGHYKHNNGPNFPTAATKISFNNSTSSMNHFANFTKGAFGVLDFANLPLTTLLQGDTQTVKVTKRCPSFATFIGNQTSVSGPQFHEETLEFDVKTRTCKPLLNIAMSQVGNTVTITWDPASASPTFDNDQPHMHFTLRIMDSLGQNAAALARAQSSFIDGTVGTATINLAPPGVNPTQHSFGSSFPGGWITTGIPASGYTGIYSIQTECRCRSRVDTGFAQWLPPMVIPTSNTQSAYGDTYHRHFNNLQSS